MKWRILLIKLSDDSDYKPFYVDEEHHPNLRVLIKAFNDSNQISLPGPSGYPEKMTQLGPKGETITPKLKKKTLYVPLAYRTQMPTTLASRIF